MKNTVAMTGAAVFVLALVLVPQPATAQAWFEDCIDSYNPTTTQEYVDPIVTPVLEAGKPYLLTVQGTMSVWTSTAWDVPACLGTPEDAPIFVSPGVTNGKVGMDPAFYFALKDYTFLCEDPPEGFGSVPYPVPKFAYKLGAGGEWVRPRPEIDEYDPVDHTYEYIIVGTGVEAYLSLKDQPANDNYGQFCVSICDREEVPLCAGQTNDIGTVTVTNDAEYLYVTFSIEEEGWYLDETHVAVGNSEDDIPQTKTGNPIPGQFPYACDLDPLQTSCTVEIELGDWCAGTPIVVAAHAAVVQIAGDGCETETFWATNVFDNVQGTLKNGGPVTDSGRTDPYDALGAPDSPQPVVNFYSLGFDLDPNEPVMGWLTVGFDYPIYNGPGYDIVVQEVTWGGGSYPEEKAEVFGVKDGTDYFAGEVTNNNGLGGLDSVDLPAGMTTFDFVKLLDATDPAKFDSRPTADGYDVDAVGACYLFLGEETAWGDGCDGTRFVDQGNWGTYFSYTINDCAEECPTP